MFEFAPGLDSAMNGCASCRDNSLRTILATTSAAPPAGYAMTTVTGLCGHSFAACAWPANAHNPARLKLATIRLIPITCLLGCGPCASAERLVRHVRVLHGAWPLPARRRGRAAPCLQQPERIILG